MFIYVKIDIHKPHILANGEDNMMVEWVTSLFLLFLHSTDKSQSSDKFTLLATKMKINYFS